MDDGLAGRGGVKQFISAGGDIAQPRAQHQQQVGLLQPLGELGVHADTQIARIVRRAIVEMALTAEGDRDGQILRGGEARADAAAASVTSRTRR